jgi:hypothetical protein
MEVYSHLNPSHQKALAALTNESPFQFSAGFTLFYKNFMKEDLKIIYLPEMNAFIPIRFISSKFFSLAQILHAPICNNVELSPSDQLLFFEKLIYYFKKRNLAERLIQPHPYGILGAVPKKARSCEFGTYVINMHQHSIDEIFNNFHPKYQKAILHSEKNGAVVKFGLNVLPDFYTCYTATMQRAGLNLERFEFFQTLYRYLGDMHVTAGVVYDKNQPVGGIFMLHSRFAALCTHAGSNGETKLYGAMKFLHFEMIKRLKAQQIKKYDLVGVRIGNNDPALEGIFRFKKGFGGELKSGYLWKIDLNPIRAKMYDMLVNLKHSQDKYKDIIDQVNS